MSTKMITKIANRLRHSFVKNKSGIMTGASIVFGIGALGTSIYGTVKAIRKVDEVKEELGVEKLKPKEFAKAVIPCYITPTLFEALSLLCLGYSVKANKETIAALTTAYSLSETAFKKYRDKTAETVGEKKETVIREKINDDYISKKPPTNDIIIETDKGDTLFYDVVSGRYFTSSIEHIKKAVNDLNRRMRDENYISLNEFYYELNLEDTDCGKQLGFSIDRGYIDIWFDAKLTPDNRPCVVINYSVPPLYNYDK